MAKNKFGDFYLKNKDKLDMAISVASSFTDFAITKSPFSFVRGGLQILNIFFGTRTSGGFFHQDNGWSPLKFYNCGISFSLYENILSKYPENSIKTEWGTTIKIINLPVGEIGLIEDQDGTMFYKTDDDPNKILNFLNSELLNSLPHKMVSIETKLSKVGYSLPKLITQEVVGFESKKAIELSELLEKAIEKNISRSFLLYGPPGTGKSAIANYLISKFGFNTLRIDSKQFSSSFTRAYFKMLNFDAILIDDIDRLDEDAPLLLFLEEARRNCKLIIATCNSLSKFSAAIRPRRFDQLIKVDSLDEDTVKHMLGDLSADWFDKVKHFPVAYISEFIDRSTLYGKDNLDVHFEELKERVAKQLKEIQDD